MPHPVECECPWCLDLELDRVAGSSPDDTLRHEISEMGRKLVEFWEPNGTVPEEVVRIIEDVERRFKRFNPLIHPGEL